MSVKTKSKGHYGAKELHDQIEKVSATLPGDVRERVMYWVDDAGEVAGAMMMLDILYHLRISDHDDLAKKAREAVGKQAKD
jgi:hypothetical protein